MQKTSAIFVAAMTVMTELAFGACPTSGRWAEFQCRDGSFCSVNDFGGSDCCMYRGGRARCPDSLPIMCNSMTCGGGDYCCASQNCYWYGGEMHHDWCPRIYRHPHHPHHPPNVVMVAKETPNLGTPNLGTGGFPPDLGTPNLGTGGFPPDLGGAAAGAGPIAHPAAIAGLNLGSTGPAPKPTLGAAYSNYQMGCCYNVGYGAYMIPCCQSPAAPCSTTGHLGDPGFVDQVPSWLCNTQGRGGGATKFQPGIGCTAFKNMGWTLVQSTADSSHSDANAATPALGTKKIPFIPMLGEEQGQPELGTKKIPFIPMLGDEQGQPELGTKKIPFIPMLGEEHGQPELGTKKIPFIPMLGEEHGQPELGTKKIPFIPMLGDQYGQPELGTKKIPFIPMLGEEHGQPELGTKKIPFIPMLGEEYEDRGERSETTYPFIPMLGEEHGQPELGTKKIPFIPMLGEEPEDSSEPDLGTKKIPFIPMLGAEDEATFGGMSDPSLGAIRSCRTSGRWSQFQCRDGSFCYVQGNSDCCLYRGGRARCPDSLPHMCNSQTCGGGDYCCASRSCRNYGGIVYYGNCPRIHNIVRSPPNVVMAKGVPNLGEMRASEDDSSDEYAPDLGATNSSYCWKDSQCTLPCPFGDMAVCDNNACTCKPRLL